MWRMLEPLMKSFLKGQSGMFCWRISEGVFHEINYIWIGSRHFVSSPDPTSIIASSISLQKVFITFTNNSKKKTSIITQSRKNLVWLTGLNYKQPKSKIPHRKTNEEFLWSVISNRHSNRKKDEKFHHIWDPFFQYTIDPTNMKKSLIYWLKFETLFIVKYNNNRSIKIII